MATTGKLFVDDNTTTWYTNPSEPNRKERRKKLKKMKYCKKHKILSQEHECGQ